MKVLKWIRDGAVRLGSWKVGRAIADWNRRRRFAAGISAADVQDLRARLERMENTLNWLGGRVDQLAHRIVTLTGRSATAEGKILNQVRDLFHEKIAAAVRQTKAGAKGK